VIPGAGLGALLDQKTKEEENQMNTRKLAFVLFVVVTVLSSACAPAAQAGVPAAPAALKPAEPAKPYVPPAAFDMKATLDKYLSNLPADFGTIMPAALKDQIASGKVSIVDVRTPQELADNGFIEGAINIPLRMLAKNLDKLPQDKASPIVTYCAIGHNGAQAMMALSLLGYTNAKSLVGGFSAWKAANLPIVTGKPADSKPSPAPHADKGLLAALDTYLSSLPGDFGTIQAAALYDRLSSAQRQPFVLDVRTPQELTDNGYIAGSVNVPLRTLIQNLDKLPQDKASPIITYCAIGHNGAQAMMALSLLGYTNVKSLVGGFAAWKAANLPIAK